MSDDNQENKVPLPEEEKLVSDVVESENTSVLVEEAPTEEVTDSDPETTEMEYSATLTNHTVEVEQSCTTPYDQVSDIIARGIKNLSAISASILYSNMADFKRIMQDANEDTAVFSNDEQLVKWNEAIQLAMAAAHVLDDGLTSATEREDADWRQYGEYEGQKIRAQKPKIANSTPGETISGEKAIRKITGLLSLGQIVQIPCWHSGFWVAIKTPTLSYQLTMERRIANAKAEAGRKTRGYVFSNDSVYMNEILMDFVIEHIFDSNLKGWNEDMLKKHLKQPDIQLLAWGMACTLYKNGYPFAQSCYADISKCTHVTEEILNVSKLLWVDNSRLTKAQRKHMSNRVKPVTQVELDRYHDDWPETPLQTYKLNDNIKLVFSIPSIEDHIQSGISWVHDLERLTEAAFGKELRNDERYEYIDTQSNATSLRRYAHWITKVVITEDDAETITTDRDTINELCTEFSSDLEVVDGILQSVSDYINDSVVALVGIPNYQCPSCKTWHMTKEGPFKYIIPVDMVSLGFLLQQFHITTVRAQGRL